VILVRPDLTTLFKYQNKYSKTGNSSARCSISLPAARHKKQRPTSILVAETAKLEKRSCGARKKINYIKNLLTMKSMKLKTGRKAVFFLDFMIFMPFMVKCFLP